MRAFVEFVMKGRAQAVFAATLATGSVLFAWVGAAIVALVILRRGFSQGAYVLFWALLPAAVLMAFGDTGPLAVLLGVSVAAVVLRATMSWPLALIAAVASGVISSIALLLFGQGFIEEILQMVNEMVVQMQSQVAPGEQVSINMPTATQIIGALGLGNAVAVVLCLMLARWWQSLLYNPGGFAKEFQGFRIPPSMLLLLLAAGFGLASGGSDYQFWALIFAVPLVFAGFGLAHGVVAVRGLGGNWLGLFYVLWLLLDPLKILLMLTVVADSWIDIRARLGKA